MFNPTTILVALVFCLGLFSSGIATGIKWEEGRQAVENNHIAEAVDAANGASAEAIAKLKPVYTTIKGETRREVETHTVYTDCKLTPGGLQLANQALLGGTKPAGEGKLPGADAAEK